MKKLTIAPYCFKAKIKLLPTSEGGRSKFISKKYRANILFGSPDPRSGEYNISGQIEFEGDAISPGGERDVFITLMVHHHLMGHLFTRSKFLIREGSRKVGDGEIIMLPEQ